jgi:hypothetical protein
VAVAEIEDEDSPQNVSTYNPRATQQSPCPQEVPQNASGVESQSTKVRENMSLRYFNLNDMITQKPVRRANPIYLFYELVFQNANGQHGEPGDKHYRCHHGSRKVLTVTKAMKSNLNGMWRRL